MCVIFVIMPLQHILLSVGICVVVDMHNLIGYTLRTVPSLSSALSIIRFACVVTF